MLDDAEMRAALDKAAASADPAVRAMALNYKEMELKLESLRAFFNFYANGSVPGEISEVRAVQPHPGRPPRTAGTPGRKPGKGSNKPDAFTEAILGILQRSAAPIRLPELQSAYEALNLEPPMQKESFRQRMHKRQKSNEVVLIPRVGFWLPEPKTEE